MTIEQTQFIVELQQLLKKYDAEMAIANNGKEWVDKYEIEVEFKDGFLNLGDYIDAEKQF